MLIFFFPTLLLPQPVERGTQSGAGGFGRFPLLRGLRSGRRRVLVCAEFHPEKRNVLQVSDRRSWSSVAPGPLAIWDLDAAGARARVSHRSGTRVGKWLLLQFSGRRTDLVSLRFPVDFWSSGDGLRTEVTLRAAWCGWPW